MPRHLLHTLLCAAALTLASCSDDDSGPPYPSLLSEMAMATADSSGNIQAFRTDGGSVYRVSNTITGMLPNSIMRTLIDYAVESEGVAKIYAAQQVPVVGDVTAGEKRLHDAQGVVSVWKAAGYINMHLMPRTQGGRQAYGYVRDSVATSPSGQQTLHISLYHDQANDPASYSRHIYASISADSIAARHHPDSVALHIFTFAGWQEWHFPL